MTSRDNSISPSPISRRRGVTAGGDGEATPGSVNADPGAQPMLPAIIPVKKDAPEDSLKRETANDFDWASDDSIVFHHQPAIACYINEAGGLTIRQERSLYGDEDVIIAIASENVAEFLDKITDVCGVPSFGGPG
jgi:hypothetical protein